MLDNEAFLRKLPVGLDDEQALLIEALVYSADAVELSYDSIQRMVLQHREDMLNPPRKLRLDIFMDIWTIVDCVHVSRQMMEALNYRSPKALEFIKIANTAKKLRDKMDHLRDQSKNLSRAKKRPPLWGSLSYIELTPDTTTIDGGEMEMRAGRIVVLSLGRVRGISDFPMSNPWDQKYYKEDVEQSFELDGAYVGGFLLTAFGISFSITDAADAFGSLIEEFNENAQKSIIPQLENYADDNGLSRDEVLGHAAADFASYEVFETKTDSTT